MRLFSSPLVSPVSGLQARTGRISGVSEPRDQQYEKSGGLNHMTSNMLEEERSPWG